MKTFVQILMRLTMLVLLGAAMVACDGGGSQQSTPSNDDSANNDAVCTEGFLGCACIDNTACFPGSDWVCVDGVCQEPSCLVGTEGCTCFSNGTCDVGNGGDPLLCNDGVCELMTCTAGTSGCTCADGGTCEGNLECVVMNGELTCAAPNCKAGAEGCPCGEGRFCEVGLACAQETCISPNCVPGTPDCWCDQNLGCQDGFQCNGDTERCEEIPCTPGSFGCGCDEGQCVGDGAYCDQNGICQEANCVAGQEGCPCDAGEVCSTGEDGERLFCEGGRCRQESCAPGEPGCACVDGFQCDAGSVCDAGVCLTEDCEPGAENCRCGSGSCRPGLRCREDNVCVDSTGFPSGACFDNGSCLRGGRCADGVCVRCSLGSVGCACDDQDGCNPGAVCQAGVCILESDLPADLPETLRCYTPCKDGAVIDGRYVSCGTDNLMRGCIDGRTCREGQCLHDGEDPRTCLSEFDCPFYQTCINGQCYSECDRDDECDDGMSCFNHVCRVPCNMTNNTCQSGYHCETTDAENGFCVPNLPQGDEEPITEVIGDFTLSAINLEMNNTAVSSSFQIRNNSPTFQTFTVRKVLHEVSFADGTGERAVRVRDGLIEGCDPLGDEPCFCQANDDCVDNNYSCVDGACRPRVCLPGACPMAWMSMASGRDELALGEEISFGIEAGAGLTVNLGDAADSAAVRWQGQLEVSSPELGSQLVNILYNEVPEGQWAGSMVYLAQFGTGQLDAWLDLPNPAPGSRPNEWAGTRNDDTVFSNVKNALVQRWAAFRFGRISFDELQAVLTAVKSESWRFANVQRACEGRGEACYLYDIGEAGVAPLSSSLESEPVPTGVVELPITVNLRIPDANQPQFMEGRIESSKALQYGGRPSMNLSFAHDPTQCSLTVQGACVVFMSDFQADIIQGGRYRTTFDDTNCAKRAGGDGFDLVAEPWLVPGFLGEAHLDPNTETFFRYECRDSQLPFSNPGGEIEEAFAAINRSLTAANPVPDGRSRRRTLRMLDGMLVNQSQMVILFEERFESFLGSADTEGFSAYGFMTLQRRPTDLAKDDLNANEIPDVYEGSTPVDDRNQPSNILEPVCSAELLDELDENAVTGANAADIVSTLITGVRRGNYVLLAPGDNEQVHYFCEETGLIDGGSGHNTANGPFDALSNDNSCVGFANNGVCEDGGSNAPFSNCELGTDRTDCGVRINSELNERIVCPPGSKVEFFTLNGNRVTQQNVADLPCQQDGTCQAQLNSWRNSPQVMIQDSDELVFRCEDPNLVYCDVDRKDLRLGKEFFAANQPGVVFTPLQTLIDQAFRYKSRFKNRSGQGVGFTPEICLPNSDQRPYCYDPENIEAIEARIDCLLHIHRNYYSVLDTPQNLDTRVLLDDYLALNFASEQEITPLNERIIHDGFERQLSQLLIMLGDESFTSAFASRFDLAQNNTASFDASLFENVGALPLTGALGFEMYSLYQAAQYYQMVLDRFYEQGPLMWEAIGQGGARNFVTPESIDLYFDRVIRASTQKARAWGEIAQRYQGLGEPDLARVVAERAYTATYMESVVMSRMMLRTLEETVVQERPQIQLAVEAAQRRYASALLDMQNVYSNINDNTTLFGFDPDYIPLPAMDNADFRQSNAVEVLLLRARNKMQFAREREDIALNQSREFETDQAQFQAELTQIRNNFEGQLGDLCGTFEGGDNRIYPATSKYAHLNERATLLGEPCGLVGNGQIHDVMASFQDLELETQSLIVSYQNVLDEVEIERQRVSEQCREILELSDHVFTEQGRINDAQAKIRKAQFDINRLQTAQNVTGQVASMANCNLEGCAFSAAAMVTYLAVTAGLEVAVAFNEGFINRKESEIAELERQVTRWQTRNECDLAKVESAARTKTMLLRLGELEIEFLRLDHRIQLAISELTRLRNQAKRLELEQAETEELTINVQAAHNNPNVRIYKNDAIINAEIAFDDAIREVYKLTRVFEYFTSTSYAKKNDLFLIRMVARGDKNLENYVAELENAFFEFEEFFGNPATRVHIVSLKNDILNIPFTDGEGTPLTPSQRTEEMRNRLTNVKLLDRNGYLTVPFSTNLEQVSPLTRNHKISYIEADIFGNDTGDYVGRVYVRQKGTGVIQSIEDTRNFHRFDERTAVVNTIFGGSRQFDQNPGFYQNFRLRDRPFVNTNWELVINQRDEEVNQDINLNSLEDIRLYIFYTDFTAF